MTVFISYMYVTALSLPILSDQLLFDGLVLERRNSIAGLVMGCTNQSI